MRFLSAAINGLHAFNELILTICKYLTIVLVGLIALDIFVGVFSRYVLNNAIAWYEESAKYLMLWMVFTACPIVLQHRGHISLDVLPRSLAPRLQNFNYLVIYTLVIALLMVLVYQGFGLAWIARKQSPTSVNMSFFYIYFAIPFGSAVMSFVSLESWLRALRGMIKPSDDDSPPQLLSPGEISGS